MSGQSKKNFKTSENFLNSLPRKKGAIDIGQLQKIGKGGAHDVFAFKNENNFVLKIERAVLERAKNFSDITPVILEKANVFILEKKSRNIEVYDAFGEENCLVEDYFLDKVLICENGADQLVNTIVTTQEKSNAFANLTKIDYNAHYIEKETDKISFDEYTELTKPLFADEFNTEIFVKYQHSFGKIFSLIEKDEKFKQKMTEFIEKFRTYYQKTGEILDFVGNENILFYQKGGEWKFQLGSVVKGDGGKVESASILDIVENDPEAHLKDEKSQQIINNLLANARVLNATAIRLGLSRIFDIPLSLKQMKVLSGRF